MDMGETGRFSPQVVRRLLGSDLVKGLLQAVQIGRERADGGMPCPLNHTAGHIGQGGKALGIARRDLATKPDVLKEKAPRSRG